ncbi:MAG: DUF4906 domain-containing protein [Bacteroidales bacterium]
MKRLFYIACLCLTLAACVREELPNISGKPSSLTLSINTMESDIKTRATTTPQSERQIFNLYIFVFNADGSIDYKKYYTFASVYDSKQLTIDGLTCNSGKSVAAIANIANANTIVDVSVAMLDKITSRSNLEALIVSIKSPSFERGTSFLMSGFAENVTVSANVANSITVYLKRVDAKIRFNITTNNNVTFTPSDWRIVSLPSKICVMKQSPNLCGTTSDCFTTEWAKFESSGATFSFFSMEHVLTPKSNILATLDNAADYALREKQTKTLNSLGDRLINGEFVYAPLTGTYVELRGNVTYNASSGVEISADVIYTVHLGGCDNKVNDYNTLRNTYYTYNVKIVSLDKIEIEVQSEVSNENEQRPGGEGDITAAQNILNLDAHNEIFILSLNQSNINETLTWNVSTPFSKGSEAVNPLDYKWIYFKINNKKDSGLRYNDDFQAYPGDNSIYTGDVNLDTYINEIKNGTDKMLDVKQMVALLKESQKRHAIGNNNNLFDTDFNVKLTAFVNEYYYETSPIDASNAVNGLWKQFTNQQQRVMNILSNLKYSPDHESSKANAVYSIRQHAIQTMYNRSLNETGYTAWGTEMIQDETPVVFDKNRNSYVSTANDKSNGRKNTINMWKESSWNTYINQNNWSLKDNYNAVKYKCLRMNRDNNGDGTIDASEVQWYLASINQLTDIWIGEWSCDPAARLYKRTTWNEQYFVSSTVLSSFGNTTNKKDDPQILWSSEGSSVGFLSRAEGSTSGTVNTPVYYRCVRNLGVPRNAGIDTKPSELATYDATTHIISLGRLDAQSIRGYYQETEELPAHHEREAANKPYKAFTVMTESVGGAYTWKSLFDITQSGTRLCPNGYRIPNQRELALMLSRIGSDGNWTLNNYFSRTRFQFDPTRPGFAVSNGGGILFLLHGENEKGGVRCVKDYVK